MRTARSLWSIAFVVAGALIPAAARAQSDGVTTVVLHSKAEGDRTIVQWAKGKKTRLDMTRPAGEGGGGGNVSIIVDGDAGTRTMVMHERKMYMTGETRAGGGRPDAGGGDKTAWTKTGKTETVAGVSCQIYHGVGVDEAGKKQEADACIAKGAGFRVDRMSTRGPMGGGALGRMLQMDVGPDQGLMKLTSYEGGPHVDLEVTKIEKKAPTDADFQPPAGYQTMQMPGMRRP